MASILRQIVAGPRTRHPEANLDLCYVTDQIIATSGPSGTYPQRAYRNPLDQLVKFLDYKHGEKWHIWEFRAEGTGYPDSEVRGKVAHYPWPDHHPPPFALVPLIMAGMRNWLHGEDAPNKQDAEGRVIVVHCKAGKGRSGSMACSYLISECGWTPSEAMARFTEKRMRPGFGQGVSIPSQVRWIGYVDRWAKSGTTYLERQVELVELHVWGLREGVKIQVEGFVDGGKTIKIFHVFSKSERKIVEGNAPGSRGLINTISDMANTLQDDAKPPRSLTETQSAGQLGDAPPKHAATIANKPGETANKSEEGGIAVVFKPSTRIILPSNDINVDFERRNRATMGWTMVTSVAHVWFNTYFEGRGPEQDGRADNEGVFEIEWDKMDGIRGSSKKGTRAFDRISVVWKAVPSTADSSQGGERISEPAPGSPVPEMDPADWKGDNATAPDTRRHLGLRTASPGTADHSRASSIKDAGNAAGGESNANPDDDDDASAAGIKPSGPGGEEEIRVVDDEKAAPSGT